MALLSAFKGLPSTTTKHGVPKLFHEPHVETGFRHLDQPWTYYVYSFFQVHNECINCWTHFLALVVTLIRICNFWTEFDLLGDQYMWPLSAGLITMVILYACSTCAHCFHNKSELLHYTWFLIDNAGIGLSGLGSGLMHHSYCFHESLLHGALDRSSVFMGALLSIFVTLCCSMSMTSYSPPYPLARRFWQLGSVMAVYVWLIFPVYERFLLHVLNQEPWDDGLGYHIQQMLWFFSGGLFFGSDMPQRLFPGRFDFIGHGHQFFHVCVWLASYKLLDGVYEDITRMKASGTFDRLPPPSFASTFGALLFVIVVNVAVVGVFIKVAYWKLKRERDSFIGIEDTEDKES